MKPSHFFFHLTELAMARPNLDIVDFREKEDESYALQLYQIDSSSSAKKSNNKIQISGQTDEISGSIISVWLDLNKKKLNIYFDGVIATREWNKDTGKKRKNRRTFCSFPQVTGSFVPAVLFGGIRAELSLQTGLATPGPPGKSIKITFN